MNKFIQNQSLIALLFIGVAGLVLALTGKIDANIYWGFLTLNFGAFTISHEVRKSKEEKKPKIEQQNINVQSPQKSKTNL